MMTTAVVGVLSLSLTACLGGKSNKSKQSATATTVSVPATSSLTPPTTADVGRLQINLGTTALTVPTATTTTTTRSGTTTTTRSGTRPDADTASMSLSTIPGVVSAGQAIQVVVKVTKQPHAIGDITLDFGDGSSVTAYQQYYPAWKPCRPGNSPLTMPFDHAYLAAGTYQVRASSPACDPAYPDLSQTFELLVLPSGATTTTVLVPTSSTSSTSTTSTSTSTTSTTRASLL